MIMIFKNNEGVAATEFALMAPALIVIFLGIFDFGLYLNTTMKLENTARAAAEYVLQGGDEDDIEDNVIMASSLNLTDDTRDSVDYELSYSCMCSDGETLACTESCETDGDYMRRYVEVTMGMDYEPLIPFPGLLESIRLAGNVRLQVN